VTMRGEVELNSTNLQIAYSLKFNYTIFSMLYKFPECGYGCLKRLEVLLNYVRNDRLGAAIIYNFFPGYKAQGKPPSTSPHFEDGTQGKP
jgi:hypothetical protein